MPSRQRNGLILLIVCGLLAASVIAVSLTPTVLGLDLKGGVELVYRASGTPQNPVSAVTMNESVQAMDGRVDQIGITDASIQTEDRNLIDVEMANASNVGEAERQVGDTSQLAFYDWEANTLLPTSEPGHPQFTAGGLEARDPTAERISQGAGTAGPGDSSAAAGGLGLYQAVKLASEQRPDVSKLHNSRAGPEYFLFGAPGSSSCRADAQINHLTLPAHTHCLLTDPLTATPGQSPASARATLGDDLPAAELTGAEMLAVHQGWIVLQGSAGSLAHPAKQWSPTARYYVLRDQAALFGSEITDPQETTDQGGAPAVAFGFTGPGGRAFQSVTATIARRGALDQIGTTAAPQHFAAVLGSQILTVPSINPQDLSGIDPSQGSEIYGGFTLTSARDLASFLRLGTLPLTLHQVSENAVSATLGAQALHQGVIAAVIGLVVVVGFLLAFYRILGLIAVAGLVTYGLYFFAVIKLIPITLTLAGMAGLVLTIGVAADANIVIFERVKEEIRAGRSVRNGIIEGYRKGLSAITDANVVTIMTAFVLFVLSTQDVKGFAFTLGVGTIVSLFTAVMATQAVLMTLGDSRTMARPSALGAGRRRRRWTCDFMGASRYFFTLSGVILLVGGFAIGGRGLNLGIDFTSGSEVTVGLSHTATPNQVRAIYRSIGDGDATVQAISGDTALGPHGFQIQSRYLDAGRYDLLRSDLEARFGIRHTQRGAEDVELNSVGPTFGSAVAHSAVIAVVVSLLLISVYVTLRFDWKYAVPVLIALAHDLLISIGVYALTGREVTVDTVAALLTILGYSMYDTIIVFDRVRENTKRMPNATFSQILNRSMSEVLTRSLATTACTLLPVIALLLFGGSTLKDFAFALLVGVASGAYSSIFIASPVLMHWKEREHGYRLRRERIIAEHGSVPAYASGAGADIDPDRKNRPRAGGRLTQPSPEGVSAREFEAMKRDLHLEEHLPEAEFRHAPDSSPTTPSFPTGAGPPRRAGNPRG